MLRTTWFGMFTINKKTSFMNSSKKKPRLSCNELHKLAELYGYTKPVVQWETRRASENHNEHL